MIMVLLYVRYQINTLLGFSIQNNFPSRKSNIITSFSVKRTDTMLKSIKQILVDPGFSLIQETSS